MKLHALFLLPLLGVACSPQETPNAAVPDPEIVSKLEEIVALEESAVKEQQLLAELGTNDAIDQLNAEIALSEARIRLAEEQNDRATITRELEAIVSQTKSILDRAQALTEEGRRSDSDLKDIRIALLEAEIRLRRHRVQD